MLTWKTNTPQFSVNGDNGNTLHLLFGETYVDDINPPEYAVRIRLFEFNKSWSAKPELYPTLKDTEEPEIDLFVSELTYSLQAHLDFDFSKYLSDWKEADPHFMAFVSDSSKHTWLE